MYKRQNLDIKQEIKTIRQSENSAIVLVPDARVTESNYVHSFNIAKEIIQENKGQNWVFADSSLYSNELFSENNQDLPFEIFQKLIITVDWNRFDKDQNKPKFPDENRQIWGGISDRTALSYDAVQVLIEGIRGSHKPTKEEIQKRLAASNFIVDGVTGPIKFQKGTGDREEKPLVLLRVCKRRNDNSLHFVPLDYSGTEVNCPMTN